LWVLSCDDLILGISELRFGTFGNHEFVETGFWKSRHPIEVPEASAVPLAVARIVPLGSVKNDRWPVVPTVTGVAVIEYTHRPLPV
jgi:hypothetical protein